MTPQHLREEPLPWAIIRRTMFRLAIAGMTEEDFIKFLGQNKISIFRFDDQKEFMEELSNA